MILIPAERFDVITATSANVRLFGKVRVLCVSSGYPLFCQLAGAFEVLFTFFFCERFSGSQFFIYTPNFFVTIKKRMTENTQERFAPVLGKRFTVLCRRYMVSWTRMDSCDLRKMRYPSRMVIISWLFLSSMKCSVITFAVHVSILRRFITHC